MSTKVKVTRKTIVGYGINTQPTSGENGEGYRFETPTAPQWWGTIKTLREQMQNDPTLNSLRGSYYASAYFVKVGSTWMIPTDQETFAWQMSEIALRLDDAGRTFFANEVEVEVDYTTEKARGAALMGRMPKGDISRENGKRGGRPRK